MIDYKPMLGQKGPTFTSTVESGKIKEYAAAVDDMNPIGYKGISQALPDLISGEIKFSAMAANLTAQHVKTDRLKVLATISKTRSKELPNVPTLIEEGYPAATVVPWYMLLAPSGTPKDIVAKFNEQITKVMAQLDVIEKLEKLGGQLIDPMKLAEIDALICSD